MQPQDEERGINIKNFIKDSPTIVKVGRSQYKIYRDFDQSRAVIQMIAEMTIQDEETGEIQIFHTPTPGWKYEKI